ncbi:methyltransferase domain-containing protein [Rhodococcoides kroppenstedtii]|uniref:methyltransferase domain-containing protein n=1 Tax=Rhodococcoides kroppenstedtii TaxID=293050 RepID=UPI003639A8A4
MIDEAVALLACPHCGAGLDADPPTLLCESGHTFDVARGGHVSLLSGGGGKFTGDSTEMVAARDRFLGSGLYDPIMDAVADVADGHRILDVGVGTGQYLARVLDTVGDGAVGVGVDVSKAAARRAARAHPRAASVVADVWTALPVRTGVIDTALSIFSPRNVPELARVLAPGGRLVVVTPTERHLQELVTALDLIRVDEHKTRRLGDSLAGTFDRTDRRAVGYTMSLAPEEVGAVVGMGPSARHVTPAELAARVTALPTPIEVTVAVTVSVYRPAAV